MSPMSNFLWGSPIWRDAPQKPQGGKRTPPMKWSPPICLYPIPLLADRHYSSPPKTTAIYRSTRTEEISLINLRSPRHITPHAAMCRPAIYYALPVQKHTGNPLNIFAFTLISINYFSGFWLHLFCTNPFQLQFPPSLELLKRKSILYAQRLNFDAFITKSLKQTWLSSEIHFCGSR